METVLTTDIEEALRLADGSTSSSRSSSVESSKSSPGSEKVGIANFFFEFIFTY